MQMNKLIGTCLLCAWVWGMQANAQESIKVGNTTRNMITYAPEGLPYNPPLVISLHGMNQDANYQKGQANWEAVADTAKFVVVYPNGINKAWDISGDTDIKFWRRLSTRCTTVTTSTVTGYISPVFPWAV